MRTATIFGVMFAMKESIAVLVLVVLGLSLHAAQIYSVPEGERIYPGYTVVVDGAAAPVSEVRCSAGPFNRRWPGQHDIGIRRQVERRGRH